MNRKKTKHVTLSGVERSTLKNIKALLIDLDGVVYISNQAIPGAADAIARLKSKSIPIRFVTNTTTMSQDSLHQKMVSMGLPIEKHEIISAVQAAVLYLRGLESKWCQVSSPDTPSKSKRTVRSGDLTAQKRPTCFLVLTDDCKRDFAEFKQTDQNPDFVVIGDLQVPGSIESQESKWCQVSSPDTSPKGNPQLAVGTPETKSGNPPLGGPPFMVGSLVSSIPPSGGTEGGWSYSLLNKIFNMLISGSKLIALHKGKFWQTAGGLTLDIGIFVAGLEYVTGQKATVIGKPSKTLFQMALRDLGVKASQAAMIGDDLDNDIKGAQAIGMKAILVKTGKYREELVKKSKVKPDAVVENVSSLV